MMNLLFTYDGRINRAKYWLGLLVSYVALAAVAGLGYLAMPSGLVRTMTDATGKVVAVDVNWTSPVALVVILVAVVVYVALIWASVCLAVKRFHDRDASGWKFMIVFIPFVGGIWFFIEVACLAGTPGPNRFGPDPLGNAYSNALAV